MPDCEVLDDDGTPADIRTGDIVTTNGGMLGLGHAGIVEVREGRIVVIEVMAAPDGSVHVQERDICDFLEDYANQDRDVFISRPKKQPADISDADWERKLRRVVDYVKERICNRYPVWQYALDLLFHLPSVWYCSDLVYEAFRREGIIIELRVPLEKASDDRDTRDFMFLWKGEVQRRFGEVLGERFLRGATLPPDWADSSCPKSSGQRSPSRSFSLGRRFDSLESMVEERLWQAYLARVDATVTGEFARFVAEAKEA